MRREVLETLVKALEGQQLKFVDRILSSAGFEVYDVNEDDEFGIVEESYWTEAAPGYVFIIEFDYTNDTKCCANFSITEHQK